MLGLLEQYACLKIDMNTIAEHLDATLCVIRNTNKSPIEDILYKTFVDD